MEFLLFNSGFNLHHDIWWDWIHFMNSFCVFCNFSHQFSFGGSRGLKPTVLGKTYKRWHLLHQSVIILGSIYFYPALWIWMHDPYLPCSHSDWMRGLFSRYLSDTVIAPRKEHPCCRLVRVKIQRLSPTTVPRETSRWSPLCLFRFS